MVTKGRFLTSTTKDELKDAKRDISSAKGELEDAVLEFDDAQSRVRQCQDTLKDAQDWLDELLEGNGLKEYEDEDISEELPALALIYGYSLLLVTYRNCKAVTEVIIKNKEGEEVKTWPYIPSLADLFEATK